MDTREKEEAVQRLTEELGEKDKQLEQLSSEVRVMCGCVASGRCDTDDCALLQCGTDLRCQTRSVRYRHCNSSWRMRWDAMEAPRYGEYLLCRLIAISAPGCLSSSAVFTVFLMWCCARNLGRAPNTKA